METKKEGFDRKWTVGMYECLGTCLFTYCILVSTGDAIAVALSLFAMIIIFGDVTGGHFNPAVTIGVLIWQFFKGDTGKNCLLSVIMIVSQICGSILGACIASFVLQVATRDFFGEFVKTKVPQDYVPILAPPDTQVTEAYGGFHLDYQTFIGQMICTWIFVLVILTVKGKNSGPSTDGVLVGMVVAATLWGLINIDYVTGACFNPAVAIGQTVFQTWHLNNTNQYLTHYLYAYTTGPAIGGALAGAFFLLFEGCF